MTSLTVNQRAAAEGTLSSFELFWRDRYDWLLSTGYQLRPRYKPDWTPSWKGTNKTRLQCEDGIPAAVRLFIRLSATGTQPPQTSRVLDAVKVEDGSFVVIKQVDKRRHPQESDIGQFLCSPPLSSDVRNHCCPILAVLDDPYDPDRQLMVMPLLRRFYQPKFASVGEAVEFFRQIFEVRVLHAPYCSCLIRVTSACNSCTSTVLLTGWLRLPIHLEQCSLTYSDISRLNVMMDSRPILPQTFHPQAPSMSRDLQRFVSPSSRTAHPVNYYITDFGLSRRYRLDEANPLEEPIMGGDKTVPEFQHDPITPRNPFPTDVYYMGNLVRENFMQVSFSFAPMFNNSNCVCRFIRTSASWNR